MKISGSSRSWSAGLSFLSLLCCVSLPLRAQTTYYVRPDGGSFSQCTGMVDAAYPGTGSGQACAWNHPFQALPPGGSPRITGGDTLLIAAGSYRMGWGAPGAEACDPDGAYECHMPSLPSGPDSSHPTRLLGEGWENGCAAAPELWGAERPWFIIDLEGSSNIDLECLEITDHASCIESHAEAEFCCRRDTAPYGDWASTGIYASDSDSVLLKNLSIHGLATNGIQAGRISNWKLERVVIRANGWAGWDGDLPEGSDSNSGELLFRKVEVAFNGCTEDWQDDSILTASCWSQTAGGYGDGFAAGLSGGHWIFEDCTVHHNTSDGIDLLYLDGNASTEIRRLDSRGNAGNQLKVSGTAAIENSVLVGNCSYFDFPGSLVDNCRALGNTLSMEFFAGQHSTVSQLTLTGEGDCLMEIGCRDDGGCGGSEVLEIRNSIFDGRTDFFQQDDTCLYWYDDSVLPTDPVDFDYNLSLHVKDDVCPGLHSLCDQDPLLRDAALSSYDAHLETGSPAIDAGCTAEMPSGDFGGLPRDSSPDIGADEYGGIFGDSFEYGSTSRWDGVH